MRTKASSVEAPRAQTPSWSGWYRRLKPFHYLFLSAFLLLLLFPLIFLLSSSFKESRYIFEYPFRLIAGTPTLDNFAKAWDSAISSFLWNSVVVAVGTTLTNILFCTMAGYALAKFRFPGRAFVLGVVLLTTIIPIDFNIIPLFVLARELGLVGTYLGIALPGIIYTFGAFMMMQFAQAVPDELLEAARLDGCSEYGIFFRIAFPLLGPPVTVLGVFSFFNSWDNFLWPAIVAIRDEKFTVPVGLASLIGNRDYNVPVILAGITLSIIPVLILFAFFQRRIVENSLSAGIK